MFETILATRYPFANSTEPIIQNDVILITMSENGFKKSNDERKSCYYFTIL